MNQRVDLPQDPARREAPGLAASLVHHAARRLPAELSDRLEEEWLADLAAQSGSLARLRFALGCCWARQAIARDALCLQARASAAGHGAIAISYHSPLPKRAAAMVLIIALHVGAVFAFIYGIRSIGLPASPGPIIGRFIPAAIPVDPPLPRPRPGFVNPSPDKPRHIPTEFVPTIPSGLYEPPNIPASTGPVASHAPVRIQGGAGKGFPDTADYYPASSIRMEESGLAAIDVCVDEKGRLTSDPRIAKSSGSPRLDSGALALARAGSGHYRSTTENGRPVPGCFPIGVRFSLRS